MTIVSKWLVIQEPWPGDTNRMAPRGQDKWCNLVGAWIAHMLQGKTEASRIYTRGTVRRPILPALMWQHHLPFSWSSSVMRSSYASRKKLTLRTPSVLIDGNDSVPSCLHSSRV